MMKKPAILSTIAIAALAMLLTACNKEDVKPDYAQAKDGEFKVRMKDAPADYLALNVEILAVQAYNKNSGWVTLNGDVQSVNVLELTNGTEMELAENSDIEAGTYTKLKLVFGGSNSLTFKDEVVVGGIATYAEVTTDVMIDGNEEVVIEINEEVSSNSGANILIDFDAAESVMKDGQNYILDPAITIVYNEATGFEGKIEGAVNAMIVVKEQDGDDEFMTYIDAQGEFLVQGMEEGAYDIIIIPGSEDIMNGAPEEFKLEGVYAVEGEFTTISTINLNG